MPAAARRPADGRGPARPRRSPRPAHGSRGRPRPATVAERSGQAGPRPAGSASPRPRSGRPAKDFSWPRRTERPAAAEVPVVPAPSRGGARNAAATAPRRPLPAGLPSVAAVGRRVALDVQAADEAGGIEVAAEDEVVVAGIAGGVGLAARAGALVRLAAIAAEIIDTAVDQALDAHPVRPALHGRNGADPHLRGDTGKAWHARFARAIGAGIAGIAVGPGIAVDAVQDRAFGQ